MIKLPKLYDELADWWQVISPTSDYADEEVFFRKIFKEAGAKTILELGADGGNVAFYLKKHFEMTLTDISPGMIAMSKQQNPECEHVLGDMRRLRLNKKFDGVFIHDAIDYMLTAEDLKAAFTSAYKHLKPGGLLVVAPDVIKENFKPNSNFEGHDDGDRSVRYIEWSWDDGLSDNKYNYDFIIGLKQGDDLRSVVDRHVCGLFPRQTWLDTFKAAGFTAKAITDQTYEDERAEIFVAHKIK